MLFSKRKNTLSKSEEKEIIRDFKKKSAEHLKEALKIFPSKHLLGNEEEWFKQVEKQSEWARKKNEEWLEKIKSKKELTEIEFQYLKEKCLLYILRGR